MNWIKHFRGLSYEDRLMTIVEDGSTLDSLLDEVDAGAAAANSRIAALEMALSTMLKSARPNVANHPTMAAAWEMGECALAGATPPPPTDRERALVEAAAAFDAYQAAEESARRAYHNYQEWIVNEFGRNVVATDPHAVSCSCPNADGYRIGTASNCPSHSNEMSPINPRGGPR